MNDYCSIIHNHQKLEITQISFRKLMDSPTVVLSLKMNKLLLYLTAWTHLKDIILNEISQSQKVTYCIIPFM